MPIAEAKKPTMRVAASIPCGPIRASTIFAAHKTIYVTNMVAKIAAQIAMNAATSNQNTSAASVSSCQVPPPVGHSAL